MLSSLSSSPILSSLSQAKETAHGILTAPPKDADKARAQQKALSTLQTLNDPATRRARAEEQLARAVTRAETELKALQYLMSIDPERAAARAEAILKDLDRAVAAFTATAKSLARSVAMSGGREAAQGRKPSGEIGNAEASGGEAVDKAGDVKAEARQAAQEARNAVKPAAERRDEMLGQIDAMQKLQKDVLDALREESLAAATEAGGDREQGDLLKKVGMLVDQALSIIELGAESEEDKDDAKDLAKRIGDNLSSAAAALKTVPTTPAPVSEVDFRA